MTKSDKSRRIESDKGKTIEALIRERVEAGMDWGDVAKDLGVSRFTLRRWIDQLGGEMVRTVRFRSEQHFRERV
jgi:transposase-like protein